MASAATIPTSTASNTTPLAQRQWRQQAQRALRIALTAVKAARSRFLELSGSGEGLLLDLCNAALHADMLPALQLGQLGTALPGVRAAAADKLSRRHEQLLAQLARLLQDLRLSVGELAAAAAAVAEVPQGEVWQRTGAVFHSITLPKAQAMFKEVVAMYDKECNSKAAVLAATAAQVVAAVGAGGGGGGAAAARGAASRSQGAAARSAELQELCAVYLSCWMLCPYLDDDAADEALGALTEDMVGW